MPYYLVGPKYDESGSGLAGLAPDLGAPYKIVRPYRESDDGFVVFVADELPEGAFRAEVPETHPVVTTRLAWWRLHPEEEAVWNG